MEIGSSASATFDMKCQSSFNEAKSVAGNHWLRLSPSVALLSFKRASLEQFGHYRGV